MFWNAEQGSCVEQLHSLSGMQKSYAGIVICTSRSIWIMENKPRVTSTARELAIGMLASIVFAIMLGGNVVGIGTQQSQVSHIFVDSTTGSTACTFAIGLVY